MSPLKTLACFGLLLQPVHVLQMNRVLVQQQQQRLFRHRFLAASDMVIRLPLDAETLLERFVAEPHGVSESGCVHAQLEVLRPQIRWCRDSQRMLDLPNAGGSSLESEALAFEVRRALLVPMPRSPWLVSPRLCCRAQVLARAFDARLVMTECELSYHQPSKMTDFAVTVFGEKIGVSVTRAFKWCPDQSSTDMTSAEARHLLRKKLKGIHSSSRNVRNMRWRKQVCCPQPHPRAHPSAAWT